MIWKMSVYNKCLFVCVVLTLQSGLGGCAGAIIGTATDVVIEVAKVPFKVGGAVVDVITEDDGDETR